MQKPLILKVTQNLPQQKERVKGGIIFIFKGIIE